MLSVFDHSALAMGTISDAFSRREEHFSCSEYSVSKQGMPTLYEEDDLIGLDQS